MDHKQAIDTQAPERYVFGELAGKERDDFEEHLADCSRCLDDLRMTESFAANTRAVFREEALATAAGRTPEKRAWFEWLRNPRALVFSGGLNVALAGVGLYALLVAIPTLESRLHQLASPVTSEQFVVQGAARGAEAVFPVKRDSAANFRMDLPRQFDRYLCTIEGTTGKGGKTYNLQVARGAETLNLTIPVASLTPGDYTVQVRGAQGSESEVLARFVLRVTGDSSH